MGVAVYILDRRRVALEIAGTRHEIGTLRRVAKLTELDDCQAAELKKATTLPSPLAAMVAVPVDLPLASAPDTLVAAHVVIGWDEGRGSVTDLGWDHLPVLGYAVRNAADTFVLHELCDDTLHLIDCERVDALGLLGGDGLLRRQGQPLIAQCRTVEAYGAGFAVASCVLEDGRQERLFLRLRSGVLPDPVWLVGRRPMDAEY